MFKTSALHLWLQTTALTGLLILLLAGPLSYLPRALPTYDHPEPPLISPAVEFALAVVLISALAAFAGFFFILDFICLLLMRAGQKVGQPAHAPTFRRHLLLNSQLLAFGILAFLLVLRPLLKLLRHIGHDPATAWALFQREVQEQTTALLPLTIALPLACLAVWLYNAPKLRAEWDAGFAK